MNLKEMKIGEVVTSATKSFYVVLGKSNIYELKNLIKKYKKNIKTLMNTGSQLPVKNVPGFRDVWYVEVKTSTKNHLSKALRPADFEYEIYDHISKIPRDFDPLDFL